MTATLSASSTGSSSNAAKSRPHLLLLLATTLIVLLNLFTGLGDMPISRIQEARVAGTAQEMLDRHEFLMPYFQGEIRLQKPPLAYWVATAGYLVYGERSHWALRFFTACIGLCSLLVLYRWVARETDGNTACFTVLCMVSSLIPLKMSRVAETDPLLMFALIVAVFLVYQLLFTDKYKPQLVLALYTAMGFGMLSKGPPALAIPLGLLLVTAITQKKLPVLARLLSPAGILVFLLLSCSWYAYVYHVEPDALLRTLSKETDDTYLHGDHYEPFYYYLNHGAGYYAPWSLLVLPCGVWLWQQRQQLPSLIRFTCSWFVLVFCILSFNANKQAHYSLLLAPSFAILMAYYLQHAAGRFRTINTIFCIALAAACTIGSAVMMQRHPVLPVFFFTGTAVIVASVIIFRKSGLQQACMILLAGSVAMATILHGLADDSASTATARTHSGNVVP